MSFSELLKSQQDIEILMATCNSLGPQVKLTINFVSADVLNLVGNKCWGFGVSFIHSFCLIALYYSVIILISAIGLATMVT